MVDENLPDMSFSELNQALENVLEKIGTIEDALAEGEDDLRLDRLYGVANKIVERMDSLVRARASPEALAQWTSVMAGYEERFEKYTDTLLDEDILLDSE